MRIVIAVCTRKRPEMLEAALDSILRVNVPDGCAVSAVIVENDDDDYARPLVEQRRGPIKIHYVREPEPGISPARNRAIEAALQLAAEWILTFDDDGEIDPDCIAEYVRAAEKFPRALAFIGRTRHIYPKGAPGWHPGLDFARKESGSRAVICATSNAFFHRTIIAHKDLNLRFDRAYGVTGGEDTDFFYQVTAAAGKIVWVEEAIVTETLPPERARLRYFYSRTIRNGQNGTRVVRKHNTAAAAFVKVLLGIYRRLILGLLQISGGSLQIPFRKTAGLKMLFSGTKELALMYGAIRAYFVRPVEWYRVPDGR